MNELIVGLQIQHNYVGVSACLVFVLMYHLRVCVWYGTRCEDFLSAYAPWASDVITHEAPFQVVCCRYHGDGSLEVILGNPQKTTIGRLPSESAATAYIQAATIIALVKASLK